ncbi:MAG: hypothetical protein COV31_01540 [Candidatus Yanofskybacteria bacterium CG10_big_fil_rev_8_21_14_0_10_46_23]|uniref:Uncharacterized protein n=1 Tax=Candidatus Yanofskybacteria bacterium CG10_big_fil_rev_8_21_14_0_10_46_23 TaxID=1975098 RepID=A0A2H0R4A9_9BACT|nr:MAG: hypothetical protein COV31_01540 [Candidatus Yanofskybacteria bacterium CG10_big_fil_rev_8_21_14_0_10_46_23]
MPQPTQPLNSLENQKNLQEALALEQEVAGLERAVADLIEKSKRFKRPSRFKYGLLFLIAIFFDAVLIFLNLSGSGLAVTILISFVGIAIISFILWFGDVRYKSAKKYQENLDEGLDLVRLKALQLERLAFKSSKLLRKIQYSGRSPQLIKNIAGKLRGGVVSSLKVVRAARKSPVWRFLLIAVADIAPILNIIPWMLIGVYLTYRDEKKLYQALAETAQQVATEFKI